METFNFKVTNESNGEIEHKTNESSFADGYTQVSAIGINNKSGKWSVSTVGKADSIRPIMNFIDRHKGVKPFYWTPPEGETGRYLTAGYKLTNLGGDVYRVTTTFTQNFGVNSTTTLTNVLTINQIGADEDGNVELSASDIGAEEEGTAQRVINALKSEEDPFSQYAKKKDIPDTSGIINEFPEVKQAVIDAVNTAQSAETSTNDAITIAESANTAANDAQEKAQTAADMATEAATAATQAVNLVERAEEAVVTANKNLTAAIETFESLNPVLSVNNEKPDEKGNITLRVEKGSEINDNKTANDSTWSSAQINNAIHADDKIPLFTTQWWADRSNIPSGFVAADGQELAHAVYPDAATALQAGQMPQVTNGLWLSDPTKRGCYVADTGNNSFRLPDYNGVQPSSLGALFIRGGNGQVADGTVQVDTIRNITGGFSTRSVQNSEYLLGVSVNSIASGAVSKGEAYKGWVYSEAGGTSYSAVSGWDFDASKVVPTAEENRPVNVTGCWIIKLYGSISNASELDASSLANAYADLAGRLTVLEIYKQEPRFTIIYPNGGTAENPATIVTSNRYVLDNPFKGYNINCRVELLINNTWGAPAYYHFMNGNTAASRGAVAHPLISTDGTDDQIIIQTGTLSVAGYSQNSGSPQGINISVASAPARLLVWRID